jgi:signal transduction histidine kinase
MASNPRILHLVAALLLAAAAIFTFDAGRDGLWANLMLGLLCMGGLLVFLQAALPQPPVRADEPAETVTDGRDDLRALLDQSPVPLIRFTPEQGAYALNRAARTLFQTDDLIASGAGDVVGVLTAPASGARRIISVFDRQYAVSVSEVMAGGGNVRLAALTDVQAEIHQAEAAALRDTLQILSHEIMNSLTPVASLADIAESYLAGKSDPEVQSAREALETLSQRARTLSRFIEAYRSVARLPEPEFQAVNIGVMTRNITDLFVRSASDGAYEFEVHVEDNLPRLWLDEAQMSQALINVITNAIEATESLDGPRRIAVHAGLARQNIVITVTDNGPGVPEAIRRNLFTAFVTTKTKGTGTGLNLARQIALAHGGNLELLDGDGDTVFAFTLPCPPKAPVAP